MEINELVLQYLTKVHSKSEEEIKPLIFNDKGEIDDKAFDNLIGLDSARVTRLKSDSNKKFDDGYSKGKKETATDIEKHLREKFGINVDGNYEQITEAIAEQMQTTKAKGKEITEDDIKKHPFFLNIEKQYVPKSEYEKITNEFSDFKKNIDRNTKLSRIKEKALLNVNSKWKIQFPTDAKRKETLMNAYLRDVISVEDVEIPDDGNIVIIKNGKRVEDAHGNPVNFDAYTEEIARGYFEFLKQDPRGGAGNENDTGNPKLNNSVYKTKQEVVEAYNKAKDAGAKPEELAAIIKAGEKLAK